MLSPDDPLAVQEQAANVALDENRCPRNVADELDPRHVPALETGTVEATLGELTGLEVRVLPCSTREVAAFKPAAGKPVLVEATLEGAAGKVAVQELGIRCVESPLEPGQQRSDNGCLAETARAIELEGFGP